MKKAHSKTDNIKKSLDDFSLIFEIKLANAGDGNNDTGELIRQLSREFSNASLSSDENKNNGTKVKSNYDYIGTLITPSCKIVVDEVIISDLLHQFLRISLPKNSSSTVSLYFLVLNLVKTIIFVIMLFVVNQIVILNLNFIVI